MTGGGSVTEEEGEGTGATPSLPLPVAGKDVKVTSGPGLCPSLATLPLLSTRQPGGHEVRGGCRRLRRRAAPRASHSISFSQTREAGLRESSGLSKGHSWETGQEEPAP